jgi:hypothetical protein
LLQRSIYVSAHGIRGERIRRRHSSPLQLEFAPAVGIHSASQMSAHFSLYFILHGIRGECIKRRHFSLQLGFAPAVILLAIDTTAAIVVLSQPSSFWPLVVRRRACSHHCSMYPLPP